MASNSNDNPYVESLQRQATSNATSPLRWLLGGGAMLAIVCCGGLLTSLMYIGLVSPETSIYLGHQVPPSYIEFAQEVGAIEPGEKIRFFYSDALLDVDEAFYFVTDDRVVIYSSDGRAPALTSVPLSSIIDARLDRNESFIEDSIVTLETDDGDFHEFPLSSEMDRDKLFFRVIQEQVQR